MKITARAGLVFIFTGMVLALAQAGYGQPSAYAVPRALPMKRIVRANFPAYFHRAQQFPLLIAEEFFPIGWSRDGKFAYYTEPVDEACGCYYANLFIQDMRTDKMVWEFKYNQDELMDANGKMPPEDNIRKLWRKNVKLFSDKLREHGIRPSSPSLLGRTFINGGKRYTAGATIDLADDPDGQSRVKRMRVSLASAGLGSKIVDDNVNKGGDDLYIAPLDAGVVGVLLSPFERRVAIVVIDVQRGWEGPPHTANVRLVGADLVSGFGSRR